MPGATATARWSPPAVAAPVLAAFERALAFVLGREGGYANDPNDHGGATMRGVIQATYDSFRDAMTLPRQPVRQITEDEVRRIYWGYFADAACPALAAKGWPTLACVVLDAAINQGDGTARKLLQRAVGAIEDKVIGPATLAAVAAKGEGPTIAAFLDVRAALYVAICERNPTQVGFLPSWLARCREGARLAQLPIGAAYTKEAQAETIAALETHHAA